jgi:very-short-patch-repair endonuclease
MHEAGDAFSSVVRLGLRQHGVFHSKQAARRDIGYQSLSRAVRAKKLERDFSQVYRIRGAPKTYESRLMAAVLWLDREDGCVSHHAAAFLWRLPGFDPGPIELSTAKFKKPLPPVVVHKSTLDLAGYTTTVAHMRVTNVGLTLVDIAGCISTDHLERAVEDAIRRRLTSVGHLNWIVGSRYGKGAKGVGDLRRLLATGSVATESDFEIRLLQMLRSEGLPEPERQYEIRDGADLVARVDFAYPWAKVAVEADSYAFHSGRRQWESDLARRNRLTALGWLVIHVTYRQMQSDMDDVVRRLRKVLTPSLHP